MQNNLGLNINDYEITKNLFNITKKIYKELTKLKNNKINNIKTNYQKITSLLEIEENLYKSIDDQSICSISLFISDLKEYSYAECYNFAKGNSGEIIKARIVNKLNYLIDNMDTEYEYEEITDIELDEFADLYDDEDEINWEEKIDEDIENKNNMISNIFDDIDNVTEVINKDILKVLFRILENEINLTNNQKLIDYKYNLAFIYDYVLNDLIKKDFEIDKDIYLNVGIDESVMKIANVLKSLFDEVTWKILDSQIKDLVINNKIEISKVIIRSTLLFSSEEVINTFKKLLSEYSIDYDLYHYLYKDMDIPKLVFIKK